MTILYQDSNYSHMQSFQKEKFYDAAQCVGNSNKTDNTFITMAMSVGSSDSDSTATTASANSARTATSTTTTNNNRGKAMSKRPGKRPGRKPAKIDERAKLERSRQSAKECRARKKLRYQYLEELVLNREKAVFSLREELEMFKQWCIQLDKGNIPAALIKMMANEDMARQRKQAEEMKRSTELQKQQQQQQKQLQQRYQRELPSTSSAGVLIISSNSSSPSSSSSSSSPSPPQVSVRSPISNSNQQHHYHHPHQQQQQQPQFLTHASLGSVPPPPYPGLGVKATSIRHGGLTRQMAFDEGSKTGSHPSHPPPPPPPSALHPQHHHLPTVPSSIKSTHPHGASSPYLSQNVYQFQKQSHSHDINPFVNKNIPTTSTTSNQIKQIDFNQRVQQQQHHYQQQQHQQRQNKIGFQNMDNVILATTTTNVNMPVSTSAYLDDISDLIRKETTTHSSGQFTTASSTSNRYSGISSTQTSHSRSRRRSLSNPFAMVNLSKQEQQPQQQQHQYIVPGYQNLPRRSASFTHRTYPVMDADTFSRKRHITSDSLSDINELPQPENEMIKNEVGLFSGIPLASRSAATTISDGDSDSGDENTNISRLFQSSSFSSTTTPTTSAQKRTLSDPDIHQRNKKARSLDSEMDSIVTESLLALYNESDPNSTAYNPISKLNNLTTVKCMGSTGTLNTPSAASPFGFTPRNTDSPMTTSSGVTSPAPSCQSGHTGSSPAPHVSSILENSNASSTLSSALMDQDTLDNTMLPSTPTSESFLFSTTATSPPVVCSETGLSATISEQIPEFYSFLADLQEDNGNISVPTTPTTMSTASILSTITPMNFGLKHQSQIPSMPPHFLQPFTNQKQGPTPLGVLNVPSILEEISSEESV